MKLPVSVHSEVLQLYPIFCVSHTTTFLYVSLQINGKITFSAVSARPSVYQNPFSHISLRY